MLSTRDVVDHLLQEGTGSSGCLCLENVDFLPQAFLQLAENSALRIVSSSDGLISTVRETDNSLDFSGSTQRFDWHKDGLYLPSLPDYVILFCKHPGERVHTDSVCR